MHPARIHLVQSENKAAYPEAAVSINVNTMLPIALLSLCVGMVAAQTLAALVDVWSSRDDYSHGFLIPIISAYLIWNLKGKLLELPLQPARPAGAGLLLLSGIAVVAAQIGSMVTPGGVALVGMIAGATLLVAGVEWTKRLIIPIGYLLFSVPILDTVIAPLHEPFQLMTAKMSTQALQWLGVPVFLDGKYIAIPEVTMEVATQCSGASLLIAVIAIGVPLAYLNLRLWWTRVGLLVFGIAVAIVANWMRVTLIGFYAHMGGEEFHGPMHIFQGLSVAWVGFIGLFIGAWLLGRVEHARGVAGPPSSIEPIHAAHAVSDAQRARVTGASWVGIGVTGVLALLVYVFTPMPTPLKQGLASFPAEIGSWKGVPVPNHAAFFLAHGADNELVREYSPLAGGQKIQLYVAYFQIQDQGKEIVNDHTGHFHHRATPMALTADGAVSANKGLLEISRETRDIVFWYEDDGIINVDRRRAKLTTIVNGLVHRRTNGTLVLISTPSKRDALPEGGQLELEQFARAVYPLLREYLP
jgi:EpsI family protein